MKAKEFRRSARDSLRGKRGVLALTLLLYSLILLGGMIILNGIGLIAELVAGGAFSLGFAVMALNVVRGREVRTENLFDGFKDFGRAFCLFMIEKIFIFLWTLLMIVPGIIKSLSYAMSYYILADDPKIGANEARKRSMKLMYGHKWQLFCLRLSFIGWILLSIPTFGILLFWLIPYINCSEAAFYLKLIGEEP